MAGTGFTSSSALAQTYRRAGLILTAEQRFLSLLLCGSDDDSIIHIEPSTGTQRGTTEIVTVQPWNRTPMPKGRTSQVWGAEGGDRQLTDSLRMGYLVLGDRAIECEISDQNEVLFSLQDSTQIGLAHDVSIVTECSMAHMLSGYSPVNNLTTGGPNGTGYSSGGTDYTMSFCNPVVEPDTYHHFFCPDSSGDNANETAVAADAGSILTDRFVNKVIRKVTSDNYGNLYPMAMPMTPWGRGFVLLCSTEGLEQVKSNTSDSDIYDLAKACIQGGMDPENSTLWTREGFKIGNVFYLAWDFCTLGTTGGTPGGTTAGTALANVQRALLLGARAAHIRWGEGFSRENWCGFSKQPFHRRVSMLSDTVVGASVFVPDRAASGTSAQRYGCAVISHYSEVTSARYS